MKNKNLIIVVIIMLSLLVFCITGGLVFLIRNNSSFDFSFNFSNSNVDLVDSMSFDNESINNIRIFTFSTDIELKESEEAKIEYYSNSEKNPKIVKDGNSIVLNEERQDVRCIGICNDKRKVIIYLPNNYNGNLNIDTTSGDVDSDVYISDSFINTTSGDIKLVEVKDINVKTTSGDISINKVSNKAFLESTSGDILINNIDIKEDSIVTTISGDVNIENNISNCYVETSSVSGDSHVSKSDRKSDIVLRVKTISGDIKVN